MHWETVAARVRGDVVIVELSGKMCLVDDGPDELLALIITMLDQGFLKFLLNLRAVPYVDSGGLASVVRAYTIVSRRGRRLELFHVGKRIRDLPDIEVVDST